MSAEKGPVITHIWDLSAPTKGEKVANTTVLRGTVVPANAGNGGGLGFRRNLPQG